jgi:YebC/PmpR family DNA-binding regulatory protein
MEGVTYEEIWYEGYAPGGIALFIQCLTDNRNRAASEVRSTLTRNGGSLGEPGSVGYLFNQKGYLLVTGAEDEVMLAALDGGAEDVAASGEQWEIVTAPGDLAAVRAALEDAGIAIDSADVTQLPTVTVPVDTESAPKVLRLVDLLDDLDDVQAVFANFDISDEVMAEVV